MHIYCLDGRDYVLWRTHPFQCIGRVLGQKISEADKETKDKAYNVQVVCLLYNVVRRTTEHEVRDD
jgi:hypothetical protein